MDGDRDMARPAAEQPTERAPLLKLHACALLKTGDAAGYRRCCARLMTLADADPSALGEAVQACVLSLIHI